MATTLSHTANDPVSTTALLRHAHHLSEGDVAKAVDILRALADAHGNAFNAIRVLRLRAKKKPCFQIERSGFIRGEERPARAVGILILGGLRFEHAGDSMAVYDASMPWPPHGVKTEQSAAIARAALIERVDLPNASEFAFFRAAHAYCDVRGRDDYNDAA